MTAAVGIITLMVALAFSLIFTRLATIALTITGMSEQAAKFQARSAFTGTGFTTDEAEQVVNHPVRRRLIMWLMIIRSAGLVTIIVSLVLSFAEKGEDFSRIIRLGIICAGIFLLWWFSKSNIIDRLLNRLVNYAMRKWTDFDVRDYAHLLRLSGEYTVIEMQVQEDDWIANKKLQQCYLRDEGITVLGILRKDGSYFGAPKGDAKIYPEDTLILYGRSKSLSNLDERRAGSQGDKQHQEAVSEQKEQADKEKRQDKIQEEKERSDEQSKSDK